MVRGASSTLHPAYVCIHLTPNIPKSRKPLLHQLQSTHSNPDLHSTRHPQTSKTPKGASPCHHS
jgi:hypothetical protein